MSEEKKNEQINGATENAEPIEYTELHEFESSSPAGSPDPPPQNAEQPEAVQSGSPDKVPQEAKQAALLSSTGELSPSESETPSEKSEGPPEENTGPPDTSESEVPQETRPGQEDPYDQKLPEEGELPPEELDWTPVYEMDQPSPASPPKKHAHRGLIITLVVICCVLLIGTGAVAGGSYYILNSGGAYEESTFFVNTYINGIDCSGMTVDEVYDAITEDIEGYTLTIIERDGEETITGTEIDLAERPDRSAIQAALDEQNSSEMITFLKQYFGSSEIEIDLLRSYDEEKAEACVAALTCLDTDQMIAPVDSELLCGDDGYYYISECVMGTTLDAEATQELILAALENFEESIDLESLGVYTSPTVTETDESLTSQLAQIETYTSACITYDFSDRTYVCDASVISDFLIQEEDGNWTVDEDLVHAWVDAMADETDTYQNHTFVTHSGTTVELPNGNYGWKLYRDTTTEDLIEYILSGTVITTEPNYYKYNAKTRATDDIGDDYVEIDLTNQMVYLYVDGECILETACVSGLATSSSRATPSWGVWALSYKAKSVTLGTYEVQGYESYVNYWMPFNGGVGLHDATWRSSFGGSIYKTNGSHGCINLPLAAAETIYNTISAGWPIIVYGE